MKFDRMHSLLCEHELRLNTAQFQIFIPFCLDCHSDVVRYNPRHPKLSKYTEKELIKQISEFPKTTIQAYNQMAPSVIANYAYELSQTFNEFYHACHVVDSEHEAFRKELIKCFRQTLKNALSLLGIETMEEM